MSPADETAEAPVAVEIHGIGSQGAGVGTLPDGRVVFVHRTAPGDEALIRVTRRKRSWARGRLVELVTPSRDRRTPPCSHYHECGGCTLEHLAYAAQRRWKGRIVADALERIGGLEVEAPEVAPSAREFRYRSRITVTLKRLGGGRVVAGFHALERPGRIVDLGGECMLPEEPVADALDGLRAAWGPEAARLPGGGTLRLTLRRIRDGVVLVVHGGRGRGRPGALLDAVPGLVAIWQVVDGQGARLLAGREETTESWLGEEIPVRAGAFLQVNRGAAGPLQREVLEALPPGTDGGLHGVRVVDAYAGVGALGRHLARKGARVVAIEADPEAVAGARSGAPDRFRAVEGRVEDRLADALPADVVVMNPPRTGLHERVPEILVERGPPRLVYVSCDPATLARDAGRLSARYGLTRLGAFDLFPQTAHVECVALFDAAGGDDP